MDQRPDDAPNEDAPESDGDPKLHKAAPGFIRRHKVGVILGTLGVFVLALLVGGGVWLIVLNDKIDDIPRVDIEVDRPDRPDRTQPKDALNVLLVGVDGRGTDVQERLEAGDTGLLSDTMMIWHLEKNHENSQVVSFPRDSWVDVPGYGEAKLNAAFSWGGPELLIQTLEDTLDLYIDHIAVVDFEGFKGITDTLGGVDLTTADGGTQHFGGDDALEYVRERKSLPGGDFDRIDRQQNFLREVLHEATSTGTRVNPVTVTNLIGDLGKLSRRRRWCIDDADQHRLLAAFGPAACHAGGPAGPSAGLRGWVASVRIRHSSRRRSRSPTPRA